MQAVVGFVIVLVSYFTLPFRFMARSYRELSEIGERGNVDFADRDDLPMLSWLLVLGRCLISIGAVLLYLFMILVAASSNDDSDSEVVLAIIFGPLIVIAYIWFWGLILEFISLQIVIARNTRMTYEALGGGPVAAPPTTRRVAAEAPQSEARCEVCGNLFPTGLLNTVEGQTMCRQCAAAASL